MNRTINLFKNNLFLYGAILWEIYNIAFLTPLATSFSNEIKFLRILGLIVIAISMFFVDNYKFQPIRQFIFLGIVIFVLYNNLFLGDNNTYLDLLLIVCASVGIDFNYFLKRFIWASVFLYSAVILLAMFKIIPSTIHGEGSNRARDSLGFSWSTFAPHELVTIFAGFMWVYKDKLNNVLLTMIFLANLFLYIKTDTRSPFFLVLLFLVIYIICNRTHLLDRVNTLVSALLLLLPSLLMLTMYYLSANVMKFPILDELLSGRLTLGNQGILSYPIKFLGQPIMFFTDNSLINQYFTLDSSYLRYLLNFGIVSSCLFILALTLVMNRIIKAGNKYYILALVLILINGFTDPWLLNFGYTPFIALFGELFFRYSMSGLNKNELHLSDDE